MRALTFWIVCLGMGLLQGSLEAAYVESQAGGIQIVREDIRPSGLLQGADYFACNTNSFPIYLTIYLTQAFNVVNGLDHGFALVRPGETIYLGYVVQQNALYSFRWYYRWRAYPATSTPLYYYGL